MSQATQPSTVRSEAILDFGKLPPMPVAPGVSMRLFASAKTDARDFATAAAEVAPGEGIAYHTHDCHEAIIVLEGVARLFCEGREYDLAALDCAFVPQGVAHALENRSDNPVRLHGSYSSPSPGRTFVPDGPFDAVDQAPERVHRSSADEPYELAPNTAFRDLFCGRLGGSDICGGYGEFEPGAGLPCHVHDYDESITIVGGEAVCQVEGREYRLSDLGTAVIPAGFAHRFLNLSDKPMKMIWVYAGTDPERRLVETQRCTGVAQASNE